MNEVLSPIPLLSIEALQAWCASLPTPGPSEPAREDVACPWHGSGALETVLSDLAGRPGAAILRCARCGLGIVSPRSIDRGRGAAEALTVIAGSILPDAVRDGVVSPDHRWFDPQRNVARHERLLNAISGWRRSGRLLAIGDDLGAVLHAAAVRGWEVAGAEESDVMAAYVTLNFGLSVRTGDGRSLPFESDAFDVVLLLGVMAHARRPAALLDEVWRVLRPGGAALLTSPNFDCIERQLHRHAWHEFGGDGAYFHSAESLDAALGSHGLVVREGIFHGPSATDLFEATTDRTLRLQIADLVSRTADPATLSARLEVVAQKCPRLPDPIDVPGCDLRTQAPEVSTFTAADLEWERLSGCPLCGEAPGASVLEIVHDGQPTRYLRCPCCEAVYLTPRLTAESQATLQEGYDAYEPAADDIEAEIARRDTLLEFFERFVPARGRLLEIGCATGFLLAAAERHGWTVSGVEPCRRFAAFARNTLGLDIGEQPFRANALPAASVDLVVIWHTLEHMNDPVTMIRDARAVLRPGGALALQVPDFDALAEFEARGDRDSLVTVVHNLLFTRPALGRLLAGCDLDVRMLERSEGMLTAVATHPVT